jgi:hypothetical protein
MLEKETVVLTTEQLRDDHHMRAKMGLLKVMFLKP